MANPLGKGQSAGGWKSWTTRKKLFVLSLVLLIIVALGVGLGVGLGIGLGGGGEGGEEGSGGETTTPEGNYTTAKWQPAVGTKWQIELLNPLNDTSVDAEIYDIDLFTNDQSTIAGLQQAGRKVICYFSAGSYENWRPDKDKFKDSDLGNDLADWPGEKWLNISSANVRQIMLARLDMARDKGCDGVDPDNVDGYDNDNGLDLTQADSVSFVNFLANAAHARNMSVGLKNAGDIIPSVIKNMQWSVNEQCAQYKECDTYAVFPQNGKPVFHIEYPKGDETNNDLSVTANQKDAACEFAGSANFSTVIKNMNLNNWVEYC
ncbi:endo alpha-1,4 polygalactosaminidase [Aspergillus novofumigatus IBT 16806]|uniref:alpha-galactosidase n=1 Tax=Aspergillus novofumigatus (strain IBT 16806) TaxID=1392255 RepID=A0A2I1C2I5_ASPN1|nr:putative endo alpha-1,4 polygalactosaminidase [Aspergillus novofumigatus IBT 16806]PKX91819.1 putative endo alpha-1,4 polygalactosaminidase [Aspergillus novofumigatus IBT 16806]